MISILDELERVVAEAKRDDAFRRELLATRQAAGSVQAFCRVCGAHGFTISAMELVAAGEEAYAAMRRSTNGGGETSPLLEGEDDLYEMVMASIG